MTEQPLNLLEQKSLSSRAMVLLVGAGVGLAAWFRVESTSPMLFIFGRLFALGTLALLFVLPRRWIILPLMLLMVTMPDLTQIPEDIPERGVVLATTAWQIGIGPVSPAIIVMSAILIAFLRLYDRGRHRPYQLVFFYFCFVPVAVSAYFGYLQESPLRFVTDAKVAAFFCMGLIIFASYYSRFPFELLRSCQVFMALAAGVFILDATRLGLGLAAPAGDLSYTSLSLDSTKGLIAGIIFWAIARLSGSRNSLIAVVVGVVAISVMVAYQTRWLIVALVAGVMLVFLLMGWKRLITLSLVGCLVVAATLPFLQKVFPEVWEITLVRFSFLTEIGPNTNLLEIEGARTGAIYNSMRLLWDHKALLTGLGYGSWYTDSYLAMPNLSIAAFDEQALESGRYYRVHDFVFHFIFKFGLIGLLLYTYVFVRPMYRIWKARRVVLRRAQWREIAIVIFGLMPMVLTSLWFSGKGLLFSAWFVVAASGWSALFQRNRAASITITEATDSALITPIFEEPRA